jgi:hypothetical protein
LCDCWLPALHAGSPLDLVQPETLRWKVFEPVLLLGKQRFSNVDIRIRVKGGGQVSQIYAIRQAISKGIVAFYQKCEWGLGLPGVASRRQQLLGQYAWLPAGLYECPSQPRLSDGGASGSSRLSMQKAKHPVLQLVSNINHQCIQLSQL